MGLLLPSSLELEGGRRKSDHSVLNRGQQEAVNMQRSFKAAQPTLELVVTVHL